RTSSPSPASRVREGPIAKGWEGLCDLARYCALPLQRGGAGRRRGAGDLAHQLVGDGVAEGVEVLHHHEEGAGAADDVLAVVFGQALGRLGVGEIARIGMLVDDGEAVD